MKTRLAGTYGVKISGCAVNDDSTRFTVRKIFLNEENSKMARLMCQTAVRQLLRGRGTSFPLSRLTSHEAVSSADDLKVRRSDSLAKPLMQRQGKQKTTPNKNIPSEFCGDISLCLKCMLFCCRAKFFSNDLPLYQLKSHRFSSEFKASNSFKKRSFSQNIHFDKLAPQRER